MWAALAAIEQMRNQRPKKQLILRRKLEPGRAYLIRIPAEGSPSLAETDEELRNLRSSLAAPQVPGKLSRRKRRKARKASTEDVTVDSARIDEVARGLGATATLIETAATSSEEAAVSGGKARSRRQRREQAKTSKPQSGQELRGQKGTDAVAPEEPARVEKETEPEPPTPARRQPPKGSEQEAVQEESRTSEEPGGSEEEVETEPATPSRRLRRREARLQMLAGGADIDRDSLSRRRRRKLEGAERKAQGRPSRRRTRKAIKQQKKSVKASAAEPPAREPSKRRARKVRDAETKVAKLQAKVEKRSTRRRRRELKRAQAQLTRLS